MRLSHHLHSIFLLVLIIAEVFFRLDERAGFFIYLGIILAGIALLIRRNNPFLAGILIIPAFRVLGLGTPLESTIRAIFLSVVILTLTIIQNIFSGGTLGFSLKTVRSLVEHREKEFSIAFVLIVLVGLGAGLAEGRITGHSAFSSSILFLAMLSAIVNEVYFRGFLLGMDGRAPILFLISLWFALLAFSGSILLFAAFFIFNLILGLSFVRYRTVYVPLLGAIAMNVAACVF